ncbi:MAG: cell division protein FtsK [Pseudonocardia sp.]|nr:cell division protein FtsK [Pseudonocardia sp.]
MTTGQLLLVLTGAGAGLWVLHKVGQAVTKILEAAAAIAVVFVTAWLAVKGLWWAGRQIVRHWRTSLTTTAVVVWCYWLGWLSLTITAAVVAVGLLGWRWAARESFEPLAGRWLRAWWQRWIVYAPRMPRWLRACGLTVADHGPGVTVQVNPFRRSAVPPKAAPRRDQSPRVIGVRSGASWDEVRVRLVAGQTPEDFDQAARSLAVARGVARCQIRELGPNLVSIDYQRRDRLADVVPCTDLGALAGVAGAGLDLRKV